MSAVSALLLFLAAGQLFSSLVVCLKNIKNPQNIALGLFLFLFSVWTFSTGMFYLVTLSEALVWAQVIYISTILVANCQIFLSLVFPYTSRFNFSLSFLSFVPSLPFVAAILFIPSLFFGQITSQGGWKEIELVTLGNTLFTVYLVFVYATSLFMVAAKYEVYRELLRMRLLYLLSSMVLVASLSLVFYVLFPWLGTHRFLFFGPLGSLLVAAILVYAILKHSLVDFRLAVVRSIVFTLITLFVAVVYAVFFFILTSIFFAREPTFEFFAWVGITLLLMFSFTSIKKLLSSVTEGVFFKGKYDTQKLLLELAGIMASTLRLDELLNLTVTKIIETVQTSKAAAVLFQGEASVKVSAWGYTSSPVLKSGEARFLYEQQKNVFLDNEINSPLVETMRHLDIAVSLPLSSGENPLGILILGAKKSGDLYSEQDREVLRILGPQLAVAIQNSKAYEEISNFNLTLKQEVENATRELRFANEKLKEVDALKDEFVSVAGHELRTPMTAIKSYLWMVLQKYAKTLPEKQKLYLDRAYLSTERLIKLVNDLLNVSRIESGRVQLDKEPVNIERIAADVISEFQHQAFQDKLKVFVQRPPRLLPEVLVDPNRIKEVLVNLVGNAFKFTPEGGTIKISFEEKEGFVLVFVTDTGKGIAESDLPKLFRKFGMLDSLSPRGEKQKGTGLGLYISRQIISLHGGQIWAESPASPAGGEPGQGTTFTFTLPVYKKSAATPSSSQILQPEEQNGQAQVLQQA